MSPGRKAEEITESLVKWKDATAYGEFHNEEDRS